MYFAGASGLLAFGGVGGYRAGWVWLTAVLAGGAAAVAWVALGAKAPGRASYVAAVALVGLVVAAVLVGRAPLSRGRLAAELDQLSLQFFEKTSEHSSGHSWCRPRCPELVRIYRGPDLPPNAVAASVTNAMSARRLVADPHDLKLGADGLYRIRGHRFAVTISSRRQVPRTNAKGEVLAPGRTIVMVRLISFRKP